MKLRTIFNILLGIALWGIAYHLGYGEGGVALAALTITNNGYDGTAERRAVALALVGNEIMDRGLAYLVERVKSKHRIRKIEMDSIIQANDATPTSSGDTNYTHRELIPGEYQIYVEFDPDELEGDWLEQFLTGDLVFRELPMEFQDDIIEEVMRIHANYMGDALLNGDTDLSSPDPKRFFDGFVKVVADDSDTITVGTPLTLTAGNILDEIKRSYDDVPLAIRNRPNLRCLMSTATHELYGDALEALSNKSRAPEDPIPTIWRGKRLEALSHFPDDTLMWVECSRDKSSNLWIGTNTTDDSDTLKVDRLQANSRLFFFQLRMKLGVQVAKPEEIVYYGS